MQARRKLIVVSNRGPTTFARDEGGERITRRGGGGLVTALRSLVSHHDVTWIASAISEEDHAVAGEAFDEAFDETGWDGSPYRLRLVRHDPQAYDWHYNVVSNPVHSHDLNATILHCLGIDHRRLSVKFQGVDIRLTGFEPHHPVKGILA